jgi:hypothetical protein
MEAATDLVRTAQREDFPGIVWCDNTVHGALQHGRLDIIIWLDENHPAAVSRSELLRMRALDVTARNGYLHMISWLVERDATLLEHAPSIVDGAAAHGYMEILEWVKGAGFDLSECWISLFVCIPLIASRGYVHAFAWFLRKSLFSPNNFRMNGLAALREALIANRPNVLWWLEKVGAISGADYADVYDDLQPFLPGPARDRIFTKTIGIIHKSPQLQHLHLHVRQMRMLVFLLCNRRLNQSRQLPYVPEELWEVFVIPLMQC